MAMTVERMLSEEEPAAALVGRVLQEAGIEYVFGISGGHTGRIVSGLRQYQNSLRMVLVREESLAGVMAEVYGRLTRRPWCDDRARAVGARQRPDGDD
jgi:acetolactate synthase-1/2/3 large subunit